MPSHALKIVRSATVGFLALMALGYGRPADADGDDFFQKSNKPLMSQLVFVGTVKDTAGNRISGALVTWTAVMSDGEQEESTFVGTYSNIIGRFRTMDVAQVVESYGYDLDPARVEVSVTKPGYTMTRRLKRTRNDQRMGLIEIDFELTAEEGRSGPAER